MYIPLHVASFGGKLAGQIGWQNVCCIPKDLHIHCIYIYKDIQLQTYIHAFMWIWRFASIYISIAMYIPLHVAQFEGKLAGQIGWQNVCDIPGDIHIHTYIYIYVYVYVCVHIYMQIYNYRHTYMHTHTQCIYIYIYVYVYVYI